MIYKKIPMSRLKELLDSEPFKQLKKTGMPQKVSPMLATLTHDYFDDDHWLYERKLDGQRCIIHCDESGEVTLFSRNHKTLNDRYPDIVQAFKDRKINNCIFDSEIVAFEGEVTSFSKLQNRMHLTDKESIEESDITVYCYIFDIIYADGYHLANLPLSTRKQILKDWMSFSNPVRYVTHRKGNGIEFLNTACDKGWEGIIAKKSDSKYIHSRSKLWLKFKCDYRQEFIIIGYTQPEGERIGFGALLLGYYDNDTLTYAGKVGTGFTDKDLKSIHNELKELRISQSPLSSTDINDTDDTHWVSPKLIAEVSFTEWTNDNKLRHPSFLGLRDDKEPTSVTKEA